jgi:hypothetical protein
MTAAVSGTDLGRILTLVFLGGTLLFAMWTSRAGHRYRRIAYVLVPIMVICAAVSSALSHGTVPGSISAAISALLVLASLAAILNRLRTTHTTISLQTVLGALSMYLLLGLLFASFYAELASVSGNPFFAQGASSGSSVNYVYFSYVTISTVGYGDLSATGDLGKMLAVGEALVGQLFLVTVVALLVTNLGKARRRRVDGEPEEEAGPPGPVAG